MKKQLLSIFVGMLFAFPTCSAFANDSEGCEIMGDYWYVQSNGVGVCSDQNDPCAGDAVSPELCVKDLFSNMIVDLEDEHSLADAFCGGIDTYEKSNRLGNNIIIKCKNGKPGNIKIKDSTSPRMGDFKDKMARFCQGLQGGIDSTEKTSSHQCDGIDNEKCEWLDKLAKQWGNEHGATMQNGTCMIY